MDPLKKARLSAYLNHHPGAFAVDDTTWDDLNMDDVFDAVNRNSSTLGEEMLYAALRTPELTEEPLLCMEERIGEYRKDKEGLHKTRSALESLGKLKKISVFEYLYALDRIEEKSMFSLLLPCILLLVSLTAFFFSVTAGVILFVAVYAYNTSAYFRLNAKIKPYLVCFSYLSLAIRTGKKMPFADQDTVKKLWPVTGGTFLLGGLRGETANGGSGNPLDLLLDLLKMGFHFDILKFYSMYGFVKKNHELIEEYLVSVGRIDLLISVGDLRESLAGKRGGKAYCIPSFTGMKRIRMEEAYHPLLKDPVANSVDTSRGILLTGSNASGKSTFLKCVALNAIFAQTLHTCFASEYEGAMFRTISSMSHRDDILSGESYYMAEIRAMKRILVLIDQKNETNPVLCFVDEILSGTNTKERIAAGAKILEYLNGHGALTFAATHDIELTDILKEEYVNYHFKEEISENDISFSYRLLPGPADSKNAIRLLALMDFPAELVKDAEEYCISLFREEADMI
ncbi:MAG: hypothetical protein K6F53_10320 [Lachnospiraceae bacterium]|nr:hypothetical protein [Lachnospiraceae bacterium]